MLKITVPGRELWDENNSVFVQMKSTDLVLEHSLVSLSKWESAYKKPFLTKEKKTREETIDYIRFMTITQNVNDEVYDQMSEETISAISKYIEDPMTATTFPDKDKGGASREVITSELIYYWMIAFTIPVDREKWHLNRLLTLIRVCSIKSKQSKPRSKSDILRQNKHLNDLRRQKLNTKG